MSVPPDCQEAWLDALALVDAAADHRTTEALIDLLTPEARRHVIAHLAKLAGAALGDRAGDVVDVLRRDVIDRTTDETP